MLTDLHIENIAVIERADISFTQGLNVLTGETGAGKSIIIDALHAVMGVRVSRELIRTGAEKALASAVFSSGRAVAWLRENELEPEDELILQRRISGDGKSSCRVSGAPVSAAQLRELSGLLLDLHGQNDGQKLLDETRHREYLDGFGSFEDTLCAYKSQYAAYLEIKNEIKRLSMDEREKARLADTLRLTIEELEAAELHAGEEESLTARRELLRNAEKLTEAVNAAYDALYGGDDNAVSLTDSAASGVARAARYSPALSTVERILMDSAFQLRDAAETLRDFMHSLDFSPEEYDALETRLALLRRLSKKYGGDEAALIARLEQARAKLDELAFADDTLKMLEVRLEQQTAAVKAEAAKLTAARKRAVVEIEARIIQELRALSMPSVRFLVDITPIGGEPGFGMSGADEIRFLMSANKGETPGPISRIASGGELSRIMLAMKNVFSEKDGIETLVFDEIDTGVSGVAASRVGEKLAQLSRSRQVLCVTHLPQIAAMADTHYVIEKSERDGRTYTSVRVLDREGRKHELARLHGGDTVTKNTLLAAGEQLDAAECFKSELGH